MILAQVALRAQLHTDVLDEMVTLVLKHAPTSERVGPRDALACVLLVFQAQQPARLGAEVTRALLRHAYVNLSTTPGHRGLHWKRSGSPEQARLRARV